MKNELDQRHDRPEFLTSEHPLLENMQQTLFKQLT